MYAAPRSELKIFDPSQPPHLLIFVDTEEEFRWHTFSSSATSVCNVRAQERAQCIFDQFGLAPTYLVDYPVAAQPDGFEPLRAMLDAGRCSIGAQLHPWVNPPIEEEITVRNTFPGNLPESLERAKIALLTAVIRANFGVTPIVFKAGRYGTGPNTARALMDHGYLIDASVMPLSDFSPEGGPNYTGSPAAPYWIDPAHRLLEIPTTASLVGLMNGAGSRTAEILLSKLSTKLKVPGLLSRLGIMERVRLTPEGISLDEAKHLTMTLLHQGQRLFVVSYHSSSLLAGGTPYVANDQAVEGIVRWLDGYCRFFFGALGGRATTPEAVLARARSSPQIMPETPVSFLPATQAMANHVH